MLLSLSVSSQTISRDSAKKVIPHSVMLELDSVPVVIVSNDLIYIHENGEYHIINTQEPDYEEQLIKLSFILILIPFLFILFAMLLS